MSGPLPCHPELAPAASTGRWLVCPACHTRVRRGAGPAERYGDDYPAARGHHDPAVGRCKVRTLERWLGALGVSPAGLTVCEVGFGGGACLAALQARGAFVLGLEPVPANRAHAESLGVPRACLFAAAPLPALPRPPDLWLFQDSFEHVPDPNSLAAWIARQSAPSAAVLMVLPDADSWSRRWMGPLWLHDVPDHLVHYTRGGVAAIFGRAGFRITREFRPVKLVSLAMVWSHLRLLAGAPAPARENARDSARVWFNLGEMGLWLERHDGRRQAAD
ncbi:MAG TPA: methyltransferase domain-containing protein [Myxococcota bacterium]|nr:methyltransferase domain-containing protein [Myxococcota bacterium]